MYVDEDAKSARQRASRRWGPATSTAIPSSGPALVARNTGLSAENLAKSFRKRPVLRDVSLSVAARRGGRPARPERRRQDHLLLHHHRADRARLRPHHARRPRHHRPADVPPRAARHRLPAAGGVDLPRPDRRAEHPRRAGAVETDARRSRSDARRPAGGVLDHPSAPHVRRWRCRAASGGGSRSPARWRRNPTSSCSTSRSPASTRSPSTTSAIWFCHLKRPRHRRADHRPQRPRDARICRPRLYPA